MVDFEALTSPTGGSGYGERMYGGGSGIINTGISFGLGKLLTGAGAERFFNKKIGRNIRKSKEFGRLQSMGGKMRARQRSAFHRGGRLFEEGISHKTANIIARTTKSYSSFLGDGGYGGPISERDVFRKTSKKYESILKEADSINKRLKSQRAISRTSIRGAARTFNVLGWGLAMSWAADIGMDIMSPKISASAARSNNQVFTRSNADSGAAYTQRQRAMMAIHDSQSSLEGVVGSEASYFHS